MLNSPEISPIPLKVSAYLDSIDVFVTGPLLLSSTKCTNWISLRSRLDFKHNWGCDDVSTTYNSAFCEADLCLQLHHVPVIRRHPSEWFLKVNVNSVLILVYLV